MKKIFSKKYSFIIICILVLSSCSMQKRLYTKGFYAHKSQSIKKHEVLEKSDALPSISIIRKQIKKPELIAGNIKKTENQSIYIKEFRTQLIDGCDTIVMKNGAKVLATINEINLTKILFRNCNSTDETIIFIKKSDVSYINFANGSKQVFDTDYTYNQPQNLPGDRNTNQNYTSTKHGRRSNSYNQSSSGKLNPFSLISFLISVVPYPFIIILFALIGLASVLPGGNKHAFAQIFGAPHMSVALLIPGVFVLAAIAMSALAIYQIKNNGSDNKKGLKLAYIALILSLILLILLLLFAF